LDSANVPAYAVSQVNFVGLHNLEKISTYLLESTTSLIHTIERLVATMREDFQMMTVASPTIRRYPASYHTITYYQSFTHNTQTRLNSLDKRINSLIQLSYNLVTQHDSRIIQVDSKIMMMIALVTILFLPANTVAAVFGSEFFSTETSSTDSLSRLQVLGQFWIFWAIVFPLTAIIIVIGVLYWKGVRREVLQRPQPARHPESSNTQHFHLFKYKILQS
jgi:Mg2+ and Co2+ transporter CorA